MEVRDASKYRGDNNVVTSPSMYRMSDSGLHQTIADMAELSEVSRLWTFRPRYFSPPINFAFGRFTSKESKADCAIVNSYYSSKRHQLMD
ncbi:hypothetical protein DPMN_134711 [Dreissena polymorpha]|uniref:Uncharacterized protein n=1 Tax=Dreissena polymorpha TaxID=45954 RepID=A0A9D4JC52_DREPO|nr:hypothetical protein DPMN_134711 [Dreissena polymorpha]